MTDELGRHVIKPSNRWYSKYEKHLAPHLKALMGPWIIGQCDVYPPAASAAKASFQAAFPPAKQTEAVVFCKEEVTGVRTYP